MNQMKNKLDLIAENNYDTIEEFAKTLEKQQLQLLKKRYN